MDDVTLLDGGTGQELIRRADADPTPLWSAQVMIDQPELVVGVHQDFLDAGADVITVNSYSATRCRLGPSGRDADYESLQRLACELAVEARGDRAHTMIAGCLSPYGWSYRPELSPPYDELWPTFAETAAIQAPYVDVILCETMGSIDEARAAVRGAATTDLPIWVAWSLRDGATARLRSGEALADAIVAIDRLSGEIDVDVQATLANCSTPETISEAMPTLVAGGRPFGGYANGFSHIADEFGPGSVTTVLGARHDVGPEEYAASVAEWLAQGATIVGGCCEIGPAHIGEIAALLGRRTAA